MEKQLWRVIGGGQNGGIVVREGQGVTSATLKNRLSTGSIVRQLSLFQGRVYYELVKGGGPSEGWVSVKVKDKEMLVQCDESGTATPQVNNKDSLAKGDDGDAAAPKSIAVEAEKEAEGSWYSRKPVVKGRKIRVLCLHGTASNSTITKMQLAPLARIANKDLELIYVDGPINAADDPKNHQLEAQQKVFPGQTLYQYVNYDYESEKGILDYKNMDEFVHHIESQMQANAPIDGIIGFSQGGIVALLLAIRAVSGKGFPLAFMCHFSASAPVFSYRFKELSQAALAVPSLHVWGNTDTVGLRGEPNDRVEDFYANPKVLHHSGDHRPFPRDKEEAAQLAPQVLSFIKDACSHSISG